MKNSYPIIAVSCNKMSTLHKSNLGQASRRRPVISHTNSFCNPVSHVNVGSQTEYKYKLQTYGIPTKDLPIDEEGNILTENHLQWIEQRRLIESQMSPTSLGDASPQSSLIMMPRRFDVLLGRGSRVSEHTGNLRAFHIVTMNREIYEKAGKFEKTRIAEKIVQLIQQSYGRFLEKGPGGCWIECDMEKSREKISHCFRRLRELDSRKASSDKAQTDTESELAGSRRRTRDQESVSVMKKHNSSL